MFIYFAPMILDIGQFLASFFLNPRPYSELVGVSLIRGSCLGVDNGFEGQIIFFQAHHIDGIGTCRHYRSFQCFQLCNTAMENAIIILPVAFDECTKWSCVHVADFMVSTQAGVFTEQRSSGGDNKIVNITAETKLWEIPKLSNLSQSSEKSPF